MSWSGLLDFDMLSAINGLEEQEIQEIIDVQDILRQSPNDVFSDIFETTKSSENRNLPPDVEEALAELESSAVPKSTRYQQCKSFKVFTDFLSKKEMNADFERMTKQTIADSLRYFYSELRTKNRSYYSTSSLGCIRAALYRHFIVKPFSFNIIKDSDFYQANAVLKGMARKFLKTMVLKSTFQ